MTYKPITDEYLAGLMAKIRAKQAADEIGRLSRAGPTPKVIITTAEKIADELNKVQQVQAITETTPKAQLPIRPKFDELVEQMEQARRPPPDVPWDMVRFVPKPTKPNKPKV